MKAGGAASWWARISAGLLLGFPLGLALAGLFVQLAPDGPGKFQLAMWLVTPPWVAALASVFLVRDGVRAWLWLGGATAAAYAALFFCRYFAG